MAACEHGGGEAYLSPFAAPPVRLEIVEGQTIRTHLREAVDAGLIDLADLQRLVIYIDGETLDRDVALDVVTEPGQAINFVVEPEKGQGGRKDVGQVALQLAVIAAAAWTAGWAGTLIAFKSTVAAAALQAAVTSAVVAAGSALSSAIFKPEAQGGRTNDRYSLQGASNAYRPWQSMPLALGEVVAAPDFAVKTFTRAVGDDVWIYGILGLHYGPCVIDELRIGDTLASSMSSDEIAVVEHLTPGPRSFSLYPYDTDETVFTEELNDDGTTTVTRATGSEGEHFELEFYFPGGLFFQKSDGTIKTATVSLSVRRRAIDVFGSPTGSWSSWTTQSVSHRTREPLRHPYTVDLPLGRYEFEAKRSWSDGNEVVTDTVMWVALRAVAYRKPITDEVLSVLEFKVKATAVNQGTLAPITCKITPVCETWDPTEGDAGDWVTPQPTSNPAALTRWLLTGPAPAKSMAEDNADAGLTEWSEICDERDWRTGLYITENSSQQDVLRMLGDAGRAGIWYDGSSIRAACWAERPVPRQLFTGRNLRGRSGSVVYPDPVHGLRVEFANIDQRGEADEVYVYADGYAEVAGGGNQAATLIEGLRLEGQRTIERAYRDGVWELNRRKLQRRVETWESDVEYIACGLGDRVLLSWRSIKEGLGEARVRSRRTAGGLVTGLRLDQAVEMKEGETYALDMRFDGQVQRGVLLTTMPGVSREVLFATPRAATDCPAGGDLVAWGVAGEVARDLEIVGIEPGEDLTARLTGRSYVAPALIAAEDATLPTLESLLSGARRQRPPTPFLLAVQGRPTGIRVGFAVTAWNGSPIAAITARWRIKPEEPGPGGWVSLPPLAASARDLITPPPRLLPTFSGSTEDVPVEVELTVVTVAGQKSEPLLVEDIIIEGDPTDARPITGARRPVQRSVLWPLSSDEDSVFVAAHTIDMDTGETFSVPAATVPASSSTLYRAFWKPGASVEIEAYPATDHMTTGSWIEIGDGIYTAAPGGGYTPPPDPPGGTPPGSQPF